jgi:hypothetical protein
MTRYRLVKRCALSRRATELQSRADRVATTSVQSRRSVVHPSSPHMCI